MKRTVEFAKSLSFSCGLALFLLIVGTAQQAQAQGIIFKGVPCAVTATGMDCVGTNSDGIYINYHIDTNNPFNSSIYAFDFLSGRSTRLTIFEDANGNVLIYGFDSELGMLDFTSGWLSVFYPTGNPFSAAVQNPMSYLMNELTIPDPWGIDAPQPRSKPQPIMPLIGY